MRGEIGHWNRKKEKRQDETGKKHLVRGKENWGERRRAKWMEGWATEGEGGGVGEEREKKSWEEKIGNKKIRQNGRWREQINK